MLQELVSLGDVVVVIGQENVDAETDGSAKKRIDGGAQDEETDEASGDEDADDDELAFHGAHDLLDVLEGVLLHPLEPHEGHVQGPGAEDQVADAEVDVDVEHAHDTQEAHDTADDGHDGHALHSALEREAKAACRVLELAAALQHGVLDSWLLKHFYFEKNL